MKKTGFGGWKQKIFGDTFEFMSTRYLMGEIAKSKMKNISETNLKQEIVLSNNFDIKRIKKKKEIASLQLLTMMSLLVPLCWMGLRQ